jgi:pimeloyl-ACP methyl ester carboxylesterase
MLTRRELLCAAGAAVLIAPRMQGSSALAQASANRPSGLQTANVDDPQSFRHHFASVNGIRLHYVEEGQGPLVVLLHGYPFLWYLWRHQIKAVAAAGYRVVAPDQRGYGQTECPQDVDAYDITHVVGDVVGLMKALDSPSAVLVGQDWGSPVVYHTALMRPDLVRGVLMMCSPPAARGAIRPSDAMQRLPKDIHFYQSFLAQPEATTEIMRDVRRFLLGIFYSTSGYCPVDQQWRWAWKAPETFADTYTVPATLPPHLSPQALDYYVAEFTRTGIQPANNWYVAVDKGWEYTSFLDGAIVQQPTLFVTGDRDPSTRPLFGIDRQGPALRALQTNFRDMRDIIMMPGVGHTPPEERPAEINAIVLKFLKDIGF